VRRFDNSSWRVAAALVTAIVTACALARERKAVDGVEVVFQTGHSEVISSVALSADGRYILSVSGDKTAKLWDVAGSRELRTLPAPGIGGGDVRFVQGAERFIIKSDEGISLVDLATGRTLRKIQSTASTRELPVAISTNGRYAAVIGDPQVTPPRLLSTTISMKTPLNIVDLSDDRVVATQVFDGSVTPKAVSDDGRAIAVMTFQFSRGGATAVWQSQIWDVTTKKLRLTLPLNPLAGQSTDVALSPDGSLYATTSRNTVELARSSNGERLFEVKLDNEHSFARAVFSPDGSLLGAGADIWHIPSRTKLARVEATTFAFGADNHTLVVGRATAGAPVLYDLQTGQGTAVVNSTSSVLDIAVTGDGALLAAASQFGGIRLWDLRSGQLVRTFVCPGGLGAYSIAADNRGSRLAAACFGGSALLWNLQGGDLVRTLKAETGDRSMPGSVRFVAGDERIVLGVNEELLVFDAADGRELRRFTLPRSASMFDMTANLPAAGLAGLSEEERTQRLEDLAGGAEMSHGVFALESHPDGRHVAVVKDNGVLLVDIESGAVIRRFARATPDVAAMQKYIQDQVDAASAPVPQASPLRRLLGVGPSIPGQDEQMQENFEAAAEFVKSAAFGPDGHRVYTLGSGGVREWDLQAGTLVAPAGNPADRGDPQDELDSSDEYGAFNSGGLVISANGRTAVRGSGNLVKILDLATGREIASLSGHTTDVTSVAFDPRERLLLSGSRDGTVIVWDVAGRKQLAQLIAFGASDYVTVTPDSYYRTSRRGLGGVAFRAQDRLYPFEQFDLRFNRPDIVLEWLGASPPEVVRGYRTAYERRLKKMGLTEQSLSGELHLPEVTFAGANPPVNTSASSLTLRVRARDTQYPLNRLNVFVNDVPVHGTAGLPVADPEARSLEQEIRVPLVPGRNKLQVSVLNQQGVESLRQTVYTTSTAKPSPPDVYIVAVGVSRYRHSAYNLRFAAKDAADLAETYRGIAAGAPQGRSPYGQVHVLDLTNEKATREEIRGARQWLAQARVNDLVVVFAAGHGMTDARQDYYFGTHDIDPQHPQLRGLPYEDFESLLDGIPALKKMLLIDTCFSGEIEKDESVLVAQTQVSGAGTVSMRSFKAARGVSVVADESANPAVDMLRFQQELFADLRRGTGAVVISSASGNEYALEGEQWSNGVFTYALLNGLRNARADTNQDNTITVSELQAFVIDEVRKLTSGGQNPTVRRENLEYDFAVY